MVGYGMERPVEAGVEYRKSLLQDKCQHLRPNIYRTRNVAYSDVTQTSTSPKTFCFTGSSSSSPCSPFPFVTGSAVVEVFSVSRARAVNAGDRLRSRSRMTTLQRPLW